MSRPFWTFDISQRYTIKIIIKLRSPLRSVVFQNKPRVQVFSRRNFQQTSRIFSQSRNMLKRYFLIIVTIIWIYYIFKMINAALSFEELRNTSILRSLARYFLPFLWLLDLFIHQFNNIVELMKVKIMISRCWVLMICL